MVRLNKKSKDLGIKLQKYKKKLLYMLSMLGKINGLKLLVFLVSSHTTQVEKDCNYFDIVVVHLPRHLNYTFHIVVYGGYF